MKKTAIRALTFLVYVTTVVPAAPVVATQGGGGNGGQAADEPRYNKTTVGTFSGAVSRISSHTGRRGNPRTRVTLKTKDGVVELHFGPTSFLEHEKLRLSVGDTLTVVGSRVKDEEGELVIVREVTQRKQVFELRNEEGRPLWDDRFK